MKLTHTVAEVCEALSISKPTLYRLMERGELAFIHIGRRRLIERAELDRFLTERRGAA